MARASVMASESFGLGLSSGPRANSMTSLLLIFWSVERGHWSSCLPGLPAMRTYQKAALRALHWAQV